MLTRFVFAAALILLLADAVRPQAPTDQDHDVIVLKSGGVARGRILDAVGGSKLVLEVANGTTIRIDFENIAFTVDNKNFNRADVPVFKGSHLRYPGKFHLFTEGTFSAGEQLTDFSISAQVGPQVTEYLTVAVGPRFDRRSRSVLTGRIHVYVLGDLIPGDDRFKELQVHLSAGVGQFVTDRVNALRNGVTNISLGVGRLFKLADETTLMVEIGYHYQSMFSSAKHIPDEDFFTLSLGFRF